MNKSRRTISIFLKNYVKNLSKHTINYYVKLVSTIFLSNFYFSLNENPSKTMNNLSLVFYFI